MTRALPFCLAVALPLAFPALVFSQNAFHKSFDFSQQVEAGIALAFPDDSHVAFAGYALENLDARITLALAKTDGTLRWSKIFDNGLPVAPTAIGRSDDGDLLVAFSQNFLQGDDAQAGVLKIAAATGNFIWQKIYAQTQALGAISQVLPVQGGYLLPANRSTINGNVKSANILKINENGDILWQTGLPENGFARQVWADEQGLIYVVGHYTGLDASDGFLAKLSPAGDLLFAKRIATNGSDYLIGIAPGNDNRLLLGGYTSGASAFSEGWLLETDLEGELKSAQAFSTPNEDIIVRSMSAMPGGRALLSVSEGAGQSKHSSLLLVNPLLAQIWSNGYSDDAGGGNSIAQMRPDANGNIFCTGTTFANGQSDLLLLKIQSDGLMPECCSKSVNYTTKAIAPTVENIFVSNISDVQPGPVTFTATDLSPASKDLCRKPNLAFSVTPNDTICAGGCIEVAFHTPTPGVGYSWTFQNGSPASSDDTQPPGKICFEKEGFVTLAAKRGQCTESNSLPIRFRNNSGEAPNAFTPNGDGTNDTFRPLLDDCAIQNYQFRIYNRWGELVFESNDPAADWDGQTPNFTLAPTDVYVWVLEFSTTENGVETPVKKRGDIALLR